MDILELENTMIPWIGRTGKLMTTFFAEKFRQHKIDLTSEQWLLLKKLYDRDGQMQNDLAIITKKNKASLARLVNTMEKKNLVARIPDHLDKRINRIFLTKKGRNTFIGTIPLVHQIFLDLQCGIPSEDINKVIETLRKVQENMKRLNE